MRIGFKPPYSKGEESPYEQAFAGGTGNREGGMRKWGDSLRWEGHLNDAARRIVYVGLPKGITFLSIGEIGYRVLGRVGAERSECPP